MKIHKKTSIPREHPHIKGVSCNVLIWDGYKHKIAYYFYSLNEWFEAGESNFPITYDFVWMYLPINKMEEVFNRITEK